MISVIIPNWNGLKLLPVCLTALRRQTLQNVEIIVVDNGSTDGSVQFIAREYPEVRVIPLPRNRGFAPAVNEGIRAARGETVALLNNDTEADGHWLEEIARALRDHPDAGMVACKLRLFDRRDHLHSAGDFCRVDGIPGNRGVWEQDCGQYDDARGLFGAQGAAAAYRKAMLDEIGLLDEELGSYIEDVDLAWRARLAGYTCAYAPAAIVYHMVSATGGGPLASYFVGRNLIFVLAKNYPAGLWKKYRRDILRAQWQITRDALRSIRGAAARARLRGQMAGLVGLPRWLGKRKQVLRRASDAEIEKVLVH
ncbi:MAG: glycosyltransferase family 2 protein [Acidobacteriota bacterium]